MAKDKFEAALDRVVSGATAAIGKALAEEMKDQIEANGSMDTRRLYDSVTWATKDAVGRDLVGGAAEEGDIISKPLEVGAVHIGSAANEAPYVEYGTGPHTSGGEDSQAFIDNIVAWANRHGFKAADGGPATEKSLYFLIQSIRKEGTNEHPFVRPTAVKAQGGAMVGALHNIIAQFLRSEFQGIKLEKTTIDIKIDIPRGNQ